MAILLVIGLLFGFIRLLDGNLEEKDVENVKNVVEIIQLFLLASAVILGGLFAFYKLELFRDFERHIIVSQKISHRFIGDGYIHIEVTATLQNGSKVRIDVQNGLFRLQQIVPISDDDILKLYTEAFVEKEKDYIQWPTLEEIKRKGEVNELIVEPGEAHPETYEFIVSKDVGSVMIYTYFYNSRFPQSPAEGWGVATVYDIIVSS